MAIVKLEALTALAAAIATAVPALAGKITIHQSVPSKIETFPNLAIVLSGRMVFDPHQRALHEDLGGNVVVWNVGAHEGPVQWRVTASTAIERSTLEAALIDFAMSRVGSPGIVVVPVTASALLSAWVAAFEYEDSTWMDQRALEREYESVITLNAIIPALVTDSAYEITTLLLGLTGDFDTTFTPDTFSSIGLVQINDDGTITPA